MKNEKLTYKMFRDFSDAIEQYFLAQKLRLVERRLYQSDDDYTRVTAVNLMNRDLNIYSNNLTDKQIRFYTQQFIELHDNYICLFKKGYYNINSEGVAVILLKQLGFNILEPMLNSSDESIERYSTSKRTYIINYIDEKDK